MVDKAFNQWASTNYFKPFRLNKKNTDENKTFLLLNASFIIICLRN